MENLLLVRHGEIGIKGLNKKYFEDKLAKQIRLALKELGRPHIYKYQSRIFVQMDCPIEDMVEKVTKVFGVVSVSPVEKFQGDIEVIKERALRHIKGIRRKVATFKVESRRSEKTFPLQSPEINKVVGGYILSNTDNLTVDVHNPDITVTVEVRDDVYLYSEVIPGPGGLPIGTGGKALILLSGGIDSPVAAWMIAKRGVEIEAVHYHSYPFTSDRAKEKVLELCRKLSVYLGKITVHMVGLTEIQKEINEHCPETQMTILTRRFMMKIAEKIALESDSRALITGESVGQVASQTLDSMYVTNSGIGLPIFRPLIGMDKVDIVNIAKDIDTFETSILPYEDCCTVFLPKHPETHPKLEKILQSESRLKADELINRAIEEKEIIVI